MGILFKFILTSFFFNRESFFGAFLLTGVKRLLILGLRIVFER